MSAIWPIQVAVAARLQASAALTPVIAGRVYDGKAPEGAPMPYVVIGEPDEESHDAFGSRGFDDTLNLHIWSAERGSSAQAHAIAVLVDAEILGGMSVEGQRVASFRPDFRTVLVEDDGTRHMPIRYRVLTREET